MEPCPICLDDMDMLSFNDRRDTTATCYKLECGHAYHTKCIIQTLSQAERKCPSCNHTKDPSTLLTEQGLAIQLLTKVKKSEDVKMAVGELRQALIEYNESIKTLKDDTKAYIEKRSLELQIPQKRRYFMECLSAVHRNAAAVAKTLNPKYIAAFEVVEKNWGGRYYRGTSFERLFYGRTQAYAISRSKHPRLWFPLY